MCLLKLVAEITTAVCLEISQRSNFIISAVFVYWAPGPVAFHVNVFLRAVFDRTKSKSQMRSGAYVIVRGSVTVFIPQTKTSNMERAWF